MNCRLKIKSCGCSGESGFSITELFVTLSVLAIVCAISIPYIVSYRKVYRSDDQAIRIMDVIRETSQLAMTRRRTMRLEIDLTDNALLQIDENNTNPDTLIKRIPLDNVQDIRVDIPPAGVTAPNPPNYNNISFATDTLGHQDSGGTTVSGHMVWAARFESQGTVVDAAGNPVSATIYVWPPSAPASSVSRSKGEIRAITLFGGSGALRYWKYDGSTFVASTQ
ncbi:MAG: hypothetical protein UZ17_ACD001000207 [Acidobacteria bacterium OLB17]|nr:MAG: hypothetical protein UZ17_ACD001000207 [Acidobacteria bacterium OLB17]